MSLQETDDSAQAVTSGLARYRSSMFARTEVGIALVILALTIAISIINPAFLTTANIFNLLRAMAITGLLAVGMTFVLVSGELDLAVGSTLALSAVGAVMLSAVMWWPLAALVAMLIGSLVNYVSGVISTRLAISSFIVTLGMLSVARGLALLFSGGMPQKGLGQLTFLGQGTIGPVPVQVVVLFVVALGAHLILTRTVFGEQVHAVGDNSEAARLSGIPVAKVKNICFVFLGALCGLAGLIRSAQLGVAEPNAAIGIELDVIAAVVIGGASLFGGRGTVLGAILGALLLAVLRNAFVLLQLSNFLQVVSIGVVIILATIFDRFRSKGESR